MTGLVNTYSVGQQDSRPWGEWAVIDAGPGFCVKRMRVKPGGVLSLQRHRHRSEHWVVVSGVAEVTRDDETFTLQPDHAVYLPRGVVHRMANRGGEVLVFIEVQAGAVLDEDDIERLEDVYGRTAGVSTASPEARPAR